jgi:hypothetical protein
VPGGVYVIRTTVRSARGSEVRRVAVRKAKGRFRTLKAFERRRSCGTLERFLLSRPVFGGRGRVPLRASYRLTGDARVGIVVRRGKKVVKRFKARNRKANRSYRVKLGARNRKRGAYKVTITVTRGSTRTRSTLVARKL